MLPFKHVHLRFGPPRGCPQAAPWVARLPTPPSLFALSEVSCLVWVMKLVQDTLSFCREEQPEAVREDMVQALISGIASHHAGCLPGWKALVEELYQQGLRFAPTSPSKKLCAYRQPQPNCIDLEALVSCPLLESS